jgi:hypothetical protein
MEIARCNDCMNAVSSFLQTSNTATAAHSLQELSPLFASACKLSSSLVDAMVVDQQMLDRQKNPRTHQSNLLTYILTGSESFYNLSGPRLRKYQHSMPSLPDINSLNDFLAYRIDSNNTNNPIVIIYAAKNRSLQDNWNDDTTAAAPPTIDTKTDRDATGTVHGTGTAGPPIHDHQTFQQCEIQCFLQLASIIQNKIIHESHKLELHAEKKHHEKEQVEALQHKETAALYQQQNETLVQQLSTSTDRTATLQKEVERLSTYVPNAESWRRQELVDQHLSTLHVDEDTAVLLTTKLRTALGELMEVSPNACYVSLETFQGIESVGKGNEKTSDGSHTPVLFAPYNGNGNKIFDSLQIVLEHKNCTLGHIAIPSVAANTAKYQTLLEWIKRVNTFVYLWRHKMATKHKERAIQKSEERVDAMVMSMEKIKHKMDQLMKGGNETRDPLTTMIELSSTEHVESATRVRLQRKNIALEMKVEKQMQQLAEQKLLHAAAEKNAVIKITELQIALKVSREHCEELRTRYQLHIARTKSLLATSSSDGGRALRR